MNKKSFIKIVSFFLSIPCLASSNFSAMRGSSVLEVYCALVKNLTFKIDSEKKVHDLEADLSNLGLNLLELTKEICSKAQTTSSDKLLNTIDHIKKFNILIQNNAESFKFVAPVNDKYLVVLNVYLHQNELAIYKQLESIKNYESILIKKNVLSNFDYSDKVKPLLSSTNLSQQEKLSFCPRYEFKLEKKELHDMKRMLTKMQEAKEQIERLIALIAQANRTKYAIQYQMKLMNSVSNNGKRLQNKKKAPYQTKKNKINLKDLENKKKDYVEIVSKKQNSEVPHSKKPKIGTLINWDKYYNAKKTSLKRTTKR